VLLERERVHLHSKKPYRLYPEDGLAVRRQRGRKRATGTREPMTVPQVLNDCWSDPRGVDRLRLPF